MSELQIALIGVGVVLVIAVWAYNVWQERRHRRRGESLLPGEAARSADVLMAGREPPPEEGSRNEPVFAAGEAAVPPAPVFVDAVEESDRTTVSAASSRPALPLPEGWADEHTDCVLRIEFGAPVGVADIQAEASSWLAVVDKPVQWLGLDVAAGDWRPFNPQEDWVTSEVAVALQLANRQGSLNDKVLAFFVAGVHQLAQRFVGLVELPSQPAVLQRGRELDDFCVGVDLQLTLLVVPRSGSLNHLMGAKLKPEIEAAGLKIRGDRFIALDADGSELFTLACQAAAAFSPAQLDAARLTALAFSFDVPRVGSGAAGFDRMVAFARRCAELLGGELVDSHKKTLTEATAQVVRERIAQIQAQMAGQGLPAGGVRALRLFA